MILYLLGGLTVIAGVGLGVFLAELGGEVVAYFIVGGIVSSVTGSLSRRS